MSKLHVREQSQTGQEQHTVQESGCVNAADAAGIGKACCRYLHEVAHQKSEATCGLSSPGVTGLKHGREYVLGPNQMSRPMVPLPEADPLQPLQP